MKAYIMGNYTEKAFQGFMKDPTSDRKAVVEQLTKAVGAVLFHLLIIIFIFKDPFINLNSDFLLAMSHQVFLVSLGAFSILMYLIKNNSASKTVSLFF